MDNFRKPRVFGYSLMIIVEGGIVKRIENSYTKCYPEERKFYEALEDAARKLIAIAPTEFTNLQSALIINSTEYKLLDKIRNEEIEKLNNIIRALRL